MDLSDVHGMLDILVEPLAVGGIAALLSMLSMNLLDNSDALWFGAIAGVAVMLSTIFDVRDILLPRVEDE